MTDEKTTEATEEKVATEETKVEETTKDTTYPDVQPGKTVRVHEEITETNPKGEEKKRVQMFEGMVLQRKHGKGVNATITVRKISGGIGVEKIYPIHSPIVKDIEVVKVFKVKRAKLGYLRTTFKKLKEIKFKK